MRNTRAESAPRQPASQAPWQRSTQGQGVTAVRQACTGNGALLQQACSAPAALHPGGKHRACQVLVSSRTPQRPAEQQLPLQSWQPLLHAAAASAGHPKLCCCSGRQPVAQGPVSASACPPRTASWGRCTRCMGNTCTVRAASSTGLPRVVQTAQRLTLSAADLPLDLSAGDACGAAELGRCAARSVPSAGRAAGCKAAACLAASRADMRASNSNGRCRACRRCLLYVCCTVCLACCAAMSCAYLRAGAPVRRAQARRRVSCAGNAACDTHLGCRVLAGMAQSCTGPFSEPSTRSWSCMRCRAQQRPAHPQQAPAAQVHSRAGLELVVVGGACSVQGQSRLSVLPWGTGARQRRARPPARSAGAQPGAL